MKKKNIATLCILAFLLLSAHPTTPIFKDLNFEEFVSIVEEKQPRNVEELLPHLPKEFMSSYTLMYDSKSAQGASYENPRAIVFGNTARFVLTFNGDPKQINYNTVEMMSFRDDIKEFELYRLVFKGDKPVLSSKNPQMCIRCHGQRPQPIWSKYDQWPGAYGSKDDFIFYGETKHYQAFQKAQIAHPIYKYLNQRLDISDEWPYGGGGGSIHVQRPNNRLGRLLGGHSAQQTAQVVLKSDFYKSYPNAALYHFLSCDRGNDEYFDKIDKLFKLRFPVSTHQLLYTQLNTIPSVRDQNAFKLEKLILNSADQNWNLAVDFLDKGVRFSPDSFYAFDEDEDADRVEYQRIDDMIGVRLLDNAVKADVELVPFYKPWTVIEKFNHNNSSTYGEQIVVPYGIADAYTSANIYMRQSKAREACSILEARALKEL